jgi:transposase InsO family protein
LDSRGLKNNPHLPNAPSGPTKSFECALANELWMTDLMFGPTLRLSEGLILQIRLFALLDDGSRLVPHAQYYDSEKLSAFLDCFRQGLARRGFPEKLYTDQGQTFTSYHLQVVCANLGVRLCHAKPYAACSLGKIERWFRTLQEDFEARLALDPVHDLAQLNARLRLLSCDRRDTQPPFSLVLIDLQREIRHSRRNVGALKLSSKEWLNHKELREHKESESLRRMSACTQQVTRCFHGSPDLSDLCDLCGSSTAAFRIIQPSPVGSFRGGLAYQPRPALLLTPFGSPTLAAGLDGFPRRTSRRPPPRRGSPAPPPRPTPAESNLNPPPR